PGERALRLAVRDESRVERDGGDAGEFDGGAGLPAGRRPEQRLAVRGEPLDVPGEHVAVAEKDDVLLAARVEPRVAADVGRGVGGRRFDPQYPDLREWDPPDRIGVRRGGRLDPDREVVPAGDGGGDTGA